MEVVRARIDSSHGVGVDGECAVQLTRINQKSTDRVYEHIMEFGFSPYSSADERESDDEYELTIKPGEEVTYTYPPTPLIRPLSEPERDALRRFVREPMTGECRLPITVIEHLIRIRKLGLFRKMHDFCRAVSKKYYFFLFLVLILFNRFQ